MYNNFDMSRRFTAIIAVLALTFFSFIFATPVKAVPVNPLEVIKGDGTTDKYLQDFCAKRQGNQMNLETWYSGKCTDDTFSGEGVGFSGKGGGAILILTQVFGESKNTI